MSMGIIQWGGKRLIAGIGSALVDILVHEDDDFLNQVGAVKGGMTLVEKSFIEKTLAATTGKPTIVPGGSACNTIIGVGKLGGPARFVGKRGQGDMGNLFEADLKQNHVEAILFTSQSPTGRVLSLITPDAQRSMFTYLGAASETTPDEITKDCFTDAAIVHIEGYLLFNADLMKTAANAAKAAGAAISLDLASFTVVEESKALLETVVDDFVDILIANEDEARSFTGHTDEAKAIRALSEKADIAVLKIGKRGSYIAHEKEIIKVDAIITGEAVDTTGAGDLWASGFLYGLVNGFPLNKCGMLGSACGCEVCQVVGTNIPEEGWRRIKTFL
ncbi:adenosine kinase [Thermodesulfobacteriota bacterium]